MLESFSELHDLMLVGEHLLERWDGYLIYLSRLQQETQSS